MSRTESSLSRFENLPVILITAVVQGWALYGLHTAITGQHWPATEPSWLLAFYAIATFIPIGIHLLAKWSRDKSTWIIVAGIAVLFSYFGWHHGSQIVDAGLGGEAFVEQWIPLGLVLVVLSLLMLPFIQARVATGQWRAPYVLLFANAWNNMLMLFEAALFTGLFWLLLLLWQQLFFMLGMKFFRELFQEPLFIYPVTSITFGIALHLIGSLDRLTKVVLEQLLNVLKWLVILAALILTLFTIALVAKLPGMIASGERAISAAWLLWLVAVTVLLVNSAYRDGSVERPYPRLIANGLRFVIPLTAVIALTALYAMYLRVDRYGLTVDRVWACIVAAAASIYSIGYAFAARDKQWMASIARVNVIAALFLIGVLALALTPVLSPYRIAATSQFSKVVQEWPRSQVDKLDNPLRYLRFSAGQYGKRRLELLSKLQDHPAADAIRKDANVALLQKNRWDATPSQRDTDALLNAMVLQPAGRALDAALLVALKDELAKPATRFMHRSPTEPLIGLFIDMDGNGTEEFVMVAQSSATIFEGKAETWQLGGRLATQIHTGQDSLVKAVGANNMRAVDPRWKNLQIGGYTFRQAGDN
jgi:hypothetical protein